MLAGIDAREIKELEKWPPEAKSYCLRSIMPYHNMDVKSERKGMLCKSFVGLGLQA